MAAKVVTTEVLKHLAQKAEKQGYNRQVTDEFLRDLDPDGFHIVSQVLLHEHAAGVQVAPHARCSVLAKAQGQDEPVEVFLDIPIDLFDLLPDAQALLERLTGSRD